MQNIIRISRLCMLVCVVFVFAQQAVHAQGWQQQTIPFPIWGFDVFFTDMQRGWLVGNSNAVFNTTNGGISWNVQAVIPTPIFHSYDGLHFLDSLTGFLVGTESNGVIRKTTDGGSNWNLVATGPGYINDIKFTNGRKGTAVGGGGAGGLAVMKTTNGGTNWQTVFSGTPYNEFVAVSYADSLNVWAVTLWDGMIYHSQNEGTTWTRQDSGRYYHQDVFFTNSQKGWVVGELGVILHTSDGGFTWTNQAIDTTGIYRRVFFVDSLTGWIVGWGGTIIHTTNGGLTWERQQSGTTLRLWGVHFIDAQTGWVVGQDGLVLHTTTGGVTSVRHELSADPLDFKLLQNYPNPFNPSTKIRFTVPSSQLTVLKVYNVLGQEVATLVNEVLKPGSYEVTWNATAFPSGVYFYRLHAGSFVQTKRLLLIK